MRAIIKTAILFASCIIVAGCSYGEKSEEEQSASGKGQIKEAEEKVDTGIQMDQTGEEEQSNEISISLGKAASNAEELAQFPPGQLTKEFSIDRETSMWVGREVPAEIKNDFLDEMRPIIESTKDPEELFAAFLHLLGGARYNEVVEPFVYFSPGFKEPILPEPYEMSAEGKPATIPSKAIILLDASSSMLLQADGKLKMDTAKSAVKGFAATIGNESDVSLYVYGHAGTQNKSDKALSCGTIEEVYPLSEYKENDFDKAVDSVKASGWTPLAGAIKQARLDHEATEEDLTLYIVSDGAETCDGNPVEEAKAFAELSKERHVNVIGFQVDKTAESQLKQVAEAGNGTYLAANSLEEMTDGISKMWLPSDLDLVSLMYFKADAWPKTMAQDKVRRMTTTARDLARVESYRFEGAAKLLAAEELIDEATKEELLDIAERHREHYNQIIDKLQEEKKKLIQAESDRIDKKIDDYMERIKKLKKEQDK